MGLLVSVVSDSWVRLWVQQSVHLLAQQSVRQSVRRSVCFPRPSLSFVPTLALVLVVSVSVLIAPLMVRQWAHW